MSLMVLSLVRLVFFTIQFYCKIWFNPFQNELKFLNFVSKIIIILPLLLAVLITLSKNVNVAKLEQTFIRKIKVVKPKPTSTHGVPYIVFCDVLLEPLPEFDHYLN